MTNGGSIAETDLGDGGAEERVVVGYNVYDKFGVTTFDLSEVSINKVSQEGIDFIKSWESLSLVPYDASGSAKRGDWTIGYGHKILPGENFANGITKSQAEALFLLDLKTKATDLVNKYVKVSLSQQQFDALTSYVFNVGASNSLIGTKLIKLLNNSDFSGAAEQMDIVTQGGHFMKGLYNRRIAEQNIWNYGRYK